MPKNIEAKSRKKALSSVFNELDTVPEIK